MSRKDGTATEKNVFIGGEIYMLLIKSSMQFDPFPGGSVFAIASLYRSLARCAGMVFGPVDEDDM